MGEIGDGSLMGGQRSRVSATGEARRVPEIELGETVHEQNPITDFGFSEEIVRENLPYMA